MRDKKLEIRDFGLAGFFFPPSVCGVFVYCGVTQQKGLSELNSRNQQRSRACRRRRGAGERKVGAHLSVGTASSLALPLCFDYFLISLPHWLAVSNSDLLDCFLDHILLV